MRKYPGSTTDDDDPASSVESGESERVRKDRPDGKRLDWLRNTLLGLPSRRDVLRGIAATGIGLVSVAVPASAGAKPKQQRKRRKPGQRPAKPNRYGCRKVDDSCRRHRQCCSGVCAGKRGRKRCRRHGAGTCSQTRPALCEAASQLTTLCNNSSNCACVRTTSGSAYCGSLVTSSCVPCKRDADCVKQGFHRGSACAPFGTGNCAGQCARATACFVPCGYVPPEEQEEAT